MFWLLVVTATAILALAFVANFLRLKKPFPVELRPNCLLTRYPVVFATGPRSIFYFLAYWNKIPDFLREHGYEVYALPLHWRNRSERAKQWQKFLERLDRDNTKCHLIVDSYTANELGDLWNERPSRIQSITIATSTSTISSNKIAKAQELKPSPLAFEYLEDETTSASTKLPLREACLWFLHRCFASGAKQLSPLTLGLAVKSDQDPILHRFLDLCIALAERDMR